MEYAWCSSNENTFAPNWHFAFHYSFSHKFEKKVTCDYYVTSAETLGLPLWLHSAPSHNTNQGLNAVICLHMAVAGWGIRWGTVEDKSFVTMV